MNISSYIYGTSFYHKLDVRPKLFFTLLFSVISFVLSSHISIAVIFILPLIIMMLSVGKRETWRCYSRLLPLFAIMILFIPFQNRDGHSLLVIRGFTLATEEGFWNVLRIISRLGGISGVLMLLLLTERSITALVISAIRMIPDTASALEERGFGRIKPPKERIPHPSGYLIQWLFSVIIPLSLLLVR